MRGVQKPELSLTMRGQKPELSLTMGGAKAGAFAYSFGRMRSKYRFTKLRDPAGISSCSIACSLSGAAASNNWRYSRFAWPVEPTELITSREYSPWPIMP